MTRVSNILKQLQLKLENNLQNNIEHSKSIYGTEYKANQDNNLVTSPYITYKIIPKYKKVTSNYFSSELITNEQDKNTAHEEIPNEKEETNTKFNIDTTDKMDTSSVEDETNTEPDMDTNFLGQQQEKPKTSLELGKIYELKKIYSRLTSIESYLSNDASQEMANIRNFVSQAIELFEVISANFDSYRDKLDEIIIMYYKFILVVYNAVKNYYFSLQKNN